MRATGHVPATLYGMAQRNIPLSVPTRELAEHAKRRDFLSRPIELDLADGTTCRVLPRKLDAHWYTFEPRHVEFLRWPSNLQAKPQKVPLPIVVLNQDQCPGMKIGGVIWSPFDSWVCRVSAEPFPHSIEVDVSRLELGQGIWLRDITLPPHVQPLPRGELKDPLLIKIRKPK